MANYGRFKKKRKDGESNRICRKNEKSIRRSWGSIDESTGRDEKTGRQKKKESRRIASRRQSDVEYKRFDV